MAYPIGKKILDCPFCGSNVELKEDRVINPNQGYSDFPFMAVFCIGCGARGPKVSIKYFNQFSNKSVEDFRNSNLLRVQEELAYDEYILRESTRAIDLWNAREVK